MQCRTMMFAVASILSVSATPSGAVDDSDEILQIKREILNLKHKIERLEKSRETGRIPRSDGGRWFGRIEVSGLLEMEAGHVSGPDGDESDLRVSTVELGLEAQVTPWINAHLLVLYEEGETDPPAFDEVILTIANPAESPFSLAAGRMYVPFGNFDSASISDPLTQTLGETRETAVQVGYLANGLHILAYGFDEGHGLALGYAREAEGGDIGFDGGLSWISNLGASDALRQVVPGALARTVAGWSFHAALHWRAFGVLGEYLAASDAFDAADLGFDAAGARPSASNIELDYAFALAGHQARVAVARQMSNEALALGLPRRRWLAALSVEGREGITLALEYARDEAYGLGDDAEATDAMTLQLAVRF